MALREEVRGPRKKWARVARMEHAIGEIPEETANQVVDKITPKLDALPGETAKAVRGVLKEELDQRFGSVPDLASMTAAEKKEWHKMQLAHHSSGISQANLEQKTLDRQKAEQKQADAERAVMQKETEKGMERARKAQEAASKKKEREAAAKKKGMIKWRRSKQRARQRATPP